MTVLSTHTLLSYGTILLGEDDLYDVQQEVVDLKASYYQLGVALRLSPQELDSIRKAFGQDIDQAFTEMLLAWLKHRYDVKRFGPPTWKRLIEAINSRVGGNNLALAKKITLSHQRGKEGCSYSHAEPVFGIGCKSEVFQTVAYMTFSVSKVGHIQSHCTIW